MKRRIVLSPEARAEMMEAADWYEGQRAGLGVEYSRTVRHALRQIETHPEHYPIVHRDLRRLVLQRFPYNLIYRVEEERLVVVAIFHSSRGPAHLATSELTTHRLTKPQLFSRLARYEQ